MSDEEDENPSEENEEDDEENEDQDEDEEDEDEDGSGDDQDEDEEDGEDQDQEENDEEDEEEDQSKEEEQKKPLPKFRSVEPEQFKFTSLLAEISSLSLNVDKFIGTLPSNGGVSYRSYVPPSRTYLPPPPPPVQQQSRVVIMKDEDVQVSMQPQIVIQPTKIQKAPLQPTYKISNESNKFLAQLYEQNKKLKRWQNSSHNMNSHTGISSVGSGFYGSKERFERQNYEKGLFNVEERNREIDQAIEKLRSEQE